MDAVSLQSFFSVCVYLALAEKLSRWYTTREKKPKQFIFPYPALTPGAVLQHPIQFGVCHK